MWPLLFATLMMLPGGVHAPGTVAPAALAASASAHTWVARGDPPVRRVLDDGTDAWWLVRRADRTARRRRPTRLLRTGIPPRARTLHLGGLDRRRDLDVEVAIRIHRSRTVARGVARLTRRVHRPQRLAPRDTRPPAA